MIKLHRFLFVSACLGLGIVVTACSSPRVNHTFSPAMAQTFEILIENPADTANAEQLREIEGYMISNMAEDFARQGLAGRVLSHPSEHTPAPNAKLVVVKLVDLRRGFTSTLSIDVTLKDGSTVLTSWKDAVRTGRSWETLVRAQNTRIATKLRRHYATPSPVPAQGLSQPSSDETASAYTPTTALPVPIETVEPF
jgi:hypothetical protein